MSVDDDAFLEQEGERLGVDKSSVIRMMIRRARSGEGQESADPRFAAALPAEAWRKLYQGKPIEEALQKADADLAALEASEPRAEEVDVPVDEDEPDYYEPEPAYQQPAAYLSPDEPTLRVAGVTDGGKPYDAAGNARVQRHKHFYGKQFGGGYVATARR